MSINTDELKEPGLFSACELSQTDWKGLVDEMKSRLEKKADKSLLESEPQEYKPDSSELPPARFWADIGRAHLECFFHKGTAPFLIVFFSGARTRQGGTAAYPTFSSWSWYKDLNASVLCVDDPMYMEYPELMLGWFYGTENEDFRSDTAVLIKHTSALLGVENKNIILFGRSGGGTAAVAVSDFIDGCCVGAVNAQLDLEHYKYYSKQFAQITGADYSGADFSARNDFAGIIKRHPQTTYLLITNLFSQTDMETDFEYLKRTFGAAAKYGVSSYSNLHLWLYAAWGVSAAHNSFDSISLFKIILSVMLALAGGAQDDDVETAVSFANDYWFERYNHLIKRSRYEKEIETLKQRLQRSEEENLRLEKQAQAQSEKLSSRLLRAVKKTVKK